MFSTVWGVAADVGGFWQNVSPLIRGDFEITNFVSQRLESLQLVACEKTARKSPR